MKKSFLLIISFLVFIVIPFLVSSCTKKNPVAPAGLFPNPFISATPTPTVTPVPVPSATVVVDNCEETAKTTNQLVPAGYWYTYNDHGDGGTSTIYPQPSPSPFYKTSDPGNGANGSDGYVRVTGTVTTVFAYGYAGLGTGLAPAPGVFDLSKYQGIVFYVKGDGKTYRFKIESPDITDSDQFGYNFTTTGAWQKITLPFNTSTFTQSGFGTPKNLLDSLVSAKGIQWQTIGQPLAAFELEVDDIYLYQ